MVVSTRWRVLVVDDNSHIRDLVRYNLEADGRFEVVGEAGDGERAIRLAADLQPDAVVLDVAMPAMNGLDALPLIRRAVGPDIVAVLLSALDQRTTSAQAANLEAVFIPKLEASALPRRLAALCSSRDLTTPRLAARHAAPAEGAP
jgi:chemotaxis response regulator CheB